MPFPLRWNSNLTKNLIFGFIFGYLEAFVFLQICSQTWVIWRDCTRGCSLMLTAAGPDPASGAAEFSVGTKRKGRLSGDTAAAKRDFETVKGVTRKRGWGKHLVVIWSK